MDGMGRCSENRGALGLSGIPFQTWGVGVLIRQQGGEYEGQGSGCSWESGGRSGGLESLGQPAGTQCWAAPIRKPGRHQGSRKAPGKGSRCGGRERR